MIFIIGLTFFLGVTGYYGAEQLLDPDEAQKIEKSEELKHEELLRALDKK